MDPSKDNQDPKNPDPAAAAGEDVTNADPNAMNNVAFPPIGEEEPGEPPKEPSDAEKLQAKVDELQTNYQKLQERYQQTIDKMLQNQSIQQQAPQQAQPQQETVSFDDLPDPVENPKDFRSKLAEKISRQRELDRQQIMGQFTQQQTQTKSLDEVWNKFQSAHEDLAADQELVTLFAKSEVERMQAQGINPQQAILADPDNFIERVATMMRTKLGKVAPQANPAQTKDAGRTADVGGGGKPPSGGGDKAPSKGFIQQLREKQLADGIL